MERSLSCEQHTRRRDTQCSSCCLAAAPPPRELYSNGCPAGSRSPFSQSLNIHDFQKGTSRTYIILNLVHTTIVECTGGKGQPRWFPIPHSSSVSALKSQDTATTTATISESAFRFDILRCGHHHLLAHLVYTTSNAKPIHFIIVLFPLEYTGALYVTGVSRAVRDHEIRPTPFHFIRD